MFLVSSCISSNYLLDNGHCEHYGVELGFCLLSVEFCFILQLLVDQFDPFEASFFLNFIF